MKTYILLTILLASASLHAADLPTVTIEHLYYLQARAERVRKFRGDEMIEYCLALKLGGAAFENVYTQICTMRIDRAKLVNVEGIKEEDPRVVTLGRSIAAYTEVLRGEAEKIQNGITREGQVATDALTAIGKAQTQ
jgi:hypothetical protein